MSDPRYAGVLDEPTTLLNIIREMLPAAAKSLTERSPSRRLTSKLQQEDYDDIRSHLMKIKLTPGERKEQNTPGTSPTRLSKAEESPAAAKTSPRRSRRRAFEADGSFEPQHRWSKRVLKTNRISTAITKPIPEDVRAFMSSHVSRLIQPMHDTLALKIQRDSQNAQTNISRALGRYAINKQYYHRMYYENDKELNPQIRTFLDKKRAILQQNARTIHTSDFYSNKRLFKKVQTQQERPVIEESEECLDFCKKIIQYSRADEPRRSQSNVDIRRTKLPFNSDIKQFQLETRALQRLMRQKRSCMHRADIHQRNLNRDEKKLRTLINLADYVGYS